MKIREVILFESYFDDLQIAIRDRLAQVVGGDMDEIPTEVFRDLMGKDGFLLSNHELKQTLNDMDVVQSVDDEVITSKAKSQMIWQSQMLKQNLK